MARLTEPGYLRVNIRLLSNCKLTVILINCSVDADIQRVGIVDTPGDVRLCQVHDCAAYEGKAARERCLGQDRKDSGAGKGATLPIGQDEPSRPSANARSAWGNGFTYVTIWQFFRGVAFVFDALARCPVDWHVSRTAHVGLVLNALEPPVNDQRLGARLASPSLGSWAAKR